MPTTSTKDIHVLIAGTYEYATLCGKRNAAGVIKLKCGAWKPILDNPGGPNVVTRILMRKDRRVREGDVRTEIKM